MEDRAPRSPWKTSHRAVAIRAGDHSTASSGGGSGYLSTSGEHSGQRVQGNREQSHGYRPSPLSLPHDSRGRNQGIAHSLPSGPGLFLHPVKASLYPSQWPRGRVQPPLFDPHNLLRTQRGLIASATFQMKKLRSKRLSRFVSLKPTMAHSHSGIALSPLLGI